MRTIARRRNPSLKVALLAAAALLLAVPAVAETYTVHLVGGGTFITRYQPQQASWDPSVALLLTDVGNWMAIPQADIESVVTDTEKRGFGLRIDSKTIVLGYVANDEPEEDEGALAEPQRPSALEEFLNRSYDIQQFVDPGDAGGGIPVYGIPYGGGGGNLNRSALPTPQPAQPPAAPQSTGPSGSEGSS